jgi:hypothetical protein
MLRAAGSIRVRASQLNSVVFFIMRASIQGAKGDSLPCFANYSLIVSP